MAELINKGLAYHCEQAQMSQECKESSDDYYVKYCNFLRWSSLLCAGSLNKRGVPLAKVVQWGRGRQVIPNLKIGYLH